MAYRERALLGARLSRTYAAACRDATALGGTRTPSLQIRRSMEHVRPVPRNPESQVSFLLGVRNGCRSPGLSGQSVRRLREVPAPCRGWPASGPGRFRPGPWSLAGGGTGAPRSMVAQGHFRRKREAPLTVEGCRRTLSGPSTDLSLAGVLNLVLSYTGRLFRICSGAISPSPGYQPLMHGCITTVRLTQRGYESSLLEMYPCDQADGRYDHEDGYRDDIGKS